ncbi:hypothetical protein EKI60_06190 [Candidatus Saccharibacteria bacterium]|nr:MAG: hypothetical protein EKI60_06190 [Candidatus Saccharibacteria bacterium]
MKTKKFLAIGIVLLLAISIGVCVSVANRDDGFEERLAPKPVMTKEEIREAFGCDRITADYRETDVFCGSEMYYNEPDKITKDDYYNKNLSCPDRLAKPRPEDPSMQGAYDICEDPNAVEVERQKFIEHLKVLKTKVLNNSR